MQALRPRNLRSPGQKARLMAHLEARIRAIEGHEWSVPNALTSPAVPDAVGWYASEPSRKAAPGGGCSLPGGGALPESLLARGVVHEWFGLLETDPWIPPLGVLIQLALRSGTTPGTTPGIVVWIGRRVWPYLVPGGHEGDAHMLERSVFVDPPDEGSRLWAIDLAARSAAVATVVADGSGLDLARTRRLQLAAESASALVLVARPPGERDRLSAAAARWSVQAAPSTDKTPRWVVELLRCKGMRLHGRDVQSEDVYRLPGGSGGKAPVIGQRWTVEWKRVEDGLAVPAIPGKRSRASSLPGQAARKQTA